MANIDGQINRIPFSFYFFYVRPFFIVIDGSARALGIVYFEFFFVVISSVIESWFMTFGVIRTVMH